MARYQWNNLNESQREAIVELLGSSSGGGGGGGAGTSSAASWRVIGEDLGPDGLTVDPADGDIQVVQFQAAQSYPAISLVPPAPWPTPTDSNPVSITGNLPAFTLVVQGGGIQVINSIGLYLQSGGSGPGQADFDAGFVTLRIYCALGTYLAEWLNPPSFDPGPYWGGIAGYGAQPTVFGTRWAHGISYQRGALVFDTDGLYLAIQPPADMEVRPAADSTAWVKISDATYPG